MSISILVFLKERVDVNVIQVIHSTDVSKIVGVMSTIFEKMCVKELESFAVVYWGKRWKDICYNKLFSSVKSGLVWDSFIVCYNKKC